MSVLITGAAGLIGSHLRKRLEKDGHDVVGTVRQDTATGMVCDIRDKRDVMSVLGTVRPETVFHLAACCRPSHSPTDFVDANIKGTSNVLSAAKRFGVREFIFASSMSAYSAPPQYLPVDENHPTQPVAMYGASKVAGEQFCAKYHDSMRVIVLRYASVFGVGDRERVIRLFMDAALSGKPLSVQGDGSQSSDFIYVDDAVEGTMRAWWKGVSGKVYNIGSGQETSIYNLAREIIATTRSDSVIETTGESNRPFRFVADITKAQRDLGYCPMLLSEGLRRYVEDLA